MTDQATRVVPAGWYEDPSDQSQVRWWNGIAWTDHTQAKPDLDAVDSTRLEEHFAATGAVRTRIRSTSTAESWLVSFTPVLLAAALLTAGWAWLYVSPTPLWLVAALVVVYAVALLCAILDRRKLARWEHTPPPLVTALLTAPVYLLVRALRLSRSWGQLVAWVLLMVGLIGAPVAAWYAGALGNVQLAVGIQSAIRDDLVGSGQAAGVSCPPIADSTSVGSIYSCDVTLNDGSHQTLWVSIDTDAGDFSYAFAIK